MSCKYLLRPLFTLTYRFVAALNRYRQIRSKATFDAMAQADSPKQGINDYFQILANNVASSDHPSGCLLISVAMPVMSRLPKVAAVMDSAPKESYARMTAFFEEHHKKGHLPEGFDKVAAITLIQDLSAAMILQARAGAPLKVLQGKVVRNTELVWSEGQRGGA